MSKDSTYAKPAHFLGALLPPVIGLLLFIFGFHANSEKVLTLFLPVVWSVMFGLGGAVVFLSKKETQGSLSESEVRTNKRVRAFSFVLIVQTALFLVMGALYLARDFLLEFPGLAKNFEWLSRLYDSFLFSYILVPSLASVIVGAWCLYVAVNNDKRIG